jgi:hypothetical protein
MEDRCSVAVNSMAADYQAAAAGSTARRSTTIPINMILWKGRLLGPHTEHHQPKPLTIHGADLRVFSLRFYGGAKISRITLEVPASFFDPKVDVPRASPFGSKWHF